MFRGHSDRKVERKIAEYGEVTRGRLFGAVAEEWREKHFAKLEHGTIVCYTPSYNRAVRDLGEIPCKDVAAADVEKIILRLKDQGMSAKTVKTQKTVLKMILDHAII